VVSSLRCSTVPLPSGRRQRRRSSSDDKDPPFSSTKAKANDKNKCRRRPDSRQTQGDGRQRRPQRQQRRRPRRGRRQHHAFPRYGSFLSSSVLRFRQDSSAHPLQFSGPGGRIPPVQGRQEAGQRWIWPCLCRPPSICCRPRATRGLAHCIVCCHQTNIPPLRRVVLENINHGTGRICAS
jgi:hypothetical protein